MIIKTYCSCRGYVKNEVEIAKYKGYYNLLIFYKLQTLENRD